MGFVFIDGEGFVQGVFGCGGMGNVDMHRTGLCGAGGRQQGRQRNGVGIHGIGGRNVGGFGGRLGGKKGFQCGRVEVGCDGEIFAVVGVVDGDV